MHILGVEVHLPIQRDNYPETGELHYSNGFLMPQYTVHAWLRRTKVHIMPVKLLAPLFSQWSFSRSRDSKPGRPQL